MKSFFTRQFAIGILFLLPFFVFGQKQSLSDNWVATDAIGRTLPSNEDVGNLRANKIVGVFYYVWHGFHDSKVHDISKILKGESTWGGTSAFHFWGEPEYGYFNAGDPWVIRRDLQMMSNAKVDFLFFDLTNAYTYLETVNTLCTVSMQMRSEGIATPDIAFITNSSSGIVINKLYDEFYKLNKFPSLWFKWQGKPLILGDVTDTNLRAEVKSFFTFRHSWVLPDPNKPNEWPWLDTSPQDYGWNTNKNVPEQITVAMAFHPENPHGQSYTNGKQPSVNASYNTVFTGQGLFAQEQWKRALEVDPAVIMVTQWNEWVAQRSIWNKGDSHYGGRPIKNGDSYFIDVFSEEFNRDMAPMKGGHTDNNYYQLVDNIRKFKGMSASQEAVTPVAISIDGNFAEWKNVLPVQWDPINDVTHRNYASYDPSVKLVNKTGRNDIVEARATYDNDNVYFYAKTNSNLSAYTDDKWMLLLINSDKNTNTGWQGYDYIINYGVTNANQTTIKKWNGTTWVAVGTAAYHAVAKELELSVPRNKVGLTGINDFFYKWVDNPGQLDDMHGIFVNGDAAPDRRFAYRCFGGTAPKLSWDFNTSGDMEGWIMKNNVTGVANGFTLAVTVTGADPYMLSPNGLTANASQYKYIYLAVRNYTSQTQGELFWTTNKSGAFDGTKHILFDLPPNDGKYHDILIDLSSIGAWADVITQLRIDPMTTGISGEIRFNSISFETTSKFDCAGIWNGTTPQVIPAVSIAMTAGDNPSCTGDALSFTATPENGGNAPSYQWKSNGNNVGTNSASYVSQTVSDGAIVTCVMTSNDECASTPKATSNGITITRKALVLPAITIELTSGDNPGCVGNQLKFTATRTNGGSAPSYQWNVNGVNSGTGNVFTSSSLVNGDAVSCVLTSNASCASTATATSNIISPVLYTNKTPTVEIAITTGENPSNAGTELVFTATATNGGGTPSYQWKVNNGNVGASITTFSSSTLHHADIVSCTMTSSGLCVTTPTATSNSITLSRIVKVTQTIALHKGWNLIATNVQPQDSSIATLFATLNVQEIKTANAFWLKGQVSSLNGFLALTPGQAYLVKMNAAGTLSIIGNPISETLQTDSLANGWNMIGCPYQRATPLSSLLNAGNCKSIKNFEGFWLPNGTGNSISDFEPGMGYYLMK